MLPFGFWLAARFAVSRESWSTLASRDFNPATTVARRVPGIRAAAVLL